MTDIVERLRDHLLGSELRGPLRYDVWQAMIELAQLREALREIRAKSGRMAEDDGLWCRAETAAEAYVQQELRQLCVVIEGVSLNECARAALQAADEIERLRATLREIAELNSAGGDAAYMMDVARRALEGGDDR